MSPAFVFKCKGEYKCDFSDPYPCQIPHHTCHKTQVFIFLWRKLTKFGVTPWQIGGNHDYQQTSTNIELELRRYMHIWGHTKLHCMAAGQRTHSARTKIRNQCVPLFKSQELVSHTLLRPMWRSMSGRGFVDFLTHKTGDIRQTHTHTGLGIELLRN